MSLPLEVLQAEVLGLPTADRAKLLDSLIGSLDADAEIEAAWDALAARFIAEFDRLMGIVRKQPNIGAPPQEWQAWYGHAEFSLHGDLSP
ncbi:MAG: hypothetical protein B7Y26_10925 [Hydrogenophilales bacterium 16-64-46]|nr:MAG: hypothetical protein B7Z32_11605 [Hydrogenophilales bacterium 12-64-13]OYZ04671.1 MAG: hypothetical protein B7Y26_10925 [Hydrogenophilales bacterium 16-64-46]OZA38357.1 MAG: hypothetical protein B7X87_07640 [Hydrogenophilales bacterium 17-64-34]HQS99713.1 addiction module protein [Thiobacillus sp.]